MVGLVCVVWFVSFGFGVWFGPVRSGPVRSGPVRSGPVRSGPVLRFGSVRFGSVRFGSVRFGSVRFGSVRFGSVRFGSVRFGLVVVCRWSSRFVHRVASRSVYRFVGRRFVSQTVSAVVYIPLSVGKQLKYACLIRFFGLRIINTIK